MAEPLDSAVFLEDATAIVQQQYFGKYEEQYADRFGSVTNKLFTPESEAISGDGKTMQFELGPADSVRFQIDPLGNIANPQNLEAGTLKVRWNRTNTALHDFTLATARVQFDIYTIENHARGTIVDLADRIYRSVQDDFDEKLAIMRHAGRTAQLCLVDGTPRQNDRETWADAAATPTNTTGMRVKIDTGSIATIRPNGRYDFIRPATGAVIAGNVRCTDIPNFTEKSAGFEFITSGLTGELSTGNLANVADNDIVVFSGTYNQGIWSFGAYFSAPSAGETFIGGMDRTDAGNRWAITQRLDAASARINKSHFNDMAIAMGFLSEKRRAGTVWMSDPTQHQRLREELGEESFIQLPIGDDRAERFMNFGSVGLNYQHGTFGTVKIVSDGLARQDRILILQNDTWKALYYGWKGLRALPADGGGHWYRMNQGTPNTGRGLIKCADWAGNCCDWCTRPWQNGVIHSLAVS